MRSECICPTSASRALASKHAFYEALWALLSEGSFDELSVAAVIRRVGCSKGRFYHHFRNKEDLLVAAYRSRTETSVRYLARRLRAGATAREAIVGDFQRLAAGTSAALRGSLLRLCIQDHPAVRVACAHDAAVRVRYMAAALRQDGIPMGEAIAMARTIYAAVVGAYVSLGPDIDPADTVAAVFASRSGDPG